MKSNAMLTDSEFIDRMYRAVKALSSLLLTPVIYETHDDSRVRFICFFDLETTGLDVYKMELALQVILERPVSILDIREFDVGERYNVIEESRLVFSSDPISQMKFEAAISFEHDLNKAEKKQMRERMREYRNGYLS